jgi:L-threonate 2-dehydrogenase
MPQRIGVIGAGVMGMGMAVCAQRAGHVVHVRDIDPQRESIARSHGLILHSSAASLAASCDVCLIVVVDAAQIDTVLSAQDGLLSRLSPGTIVAICSTIAPTDTTRFADRVLAAGGRFVDAPISGGPVRAENGTMSMMLAAPADTLADIASLVQALCSRHFIIGTEPGAAAKAKLVNNLMAGINLAAGAEALALAAALGLDPHQMRELISVSSGQSWMFDDRMPRALDGDYEPRAQSHVLTKDLTLANMAASAIGLDLPMGAVARDLLRQTCEGGWRHEDDAAMYKYYRKRFGLD